MGPQKETIKHGGGVSNSYYIIQPPNMCRNMAMTVCPCCNHHIEHQSRHSVMLLGSSPRTQSVQQHRNLLLERVGIVVQGVVWAMSVARVASVSDGLDAISTSLQLGFPTSHKCCEQINQNLARNCQIQVEISEKNVDCENEMEMLGFPKILTAGG